MYFLWEWEKEKEDRVTGSFWNKWSHNFKNPRKYQKQLRLSLAIYPALNNCLLLHKFWFFLIPATFLILPSHKPCCLAGMPHWGSRAEIRSNELRALLFMGSIKALPQGDIIFPSSSLGVWAPQSDCQQPSQSKFNLALNLGGAPAGLSWKCRILALCLRLQSRVWTAKENRAWVKQWEEKEAKTLT